VVSSDEIVHHLIRNDPEVKAAMVERLGEEILGEDGEIDRSRVAERVFGDREALAWLEALLHPKVSTEYLRWRDQVAELPDPPPVTVTEVPLLYEVGGETRFDKVVVITAPEKLRDARSRVPLAGRSDRLLPDREKVKRADFTYVNTGSLEELDAFVAQVMEQLTAG
jgi:dephospho-CoA kinase